VPALEGAPHELDRVARRAVATRPGHERRARRPEAIEPIADLADAVHDCDVVTELPASPPLDPVLPDSVPLEPELLASAPLDSAPLDSVALAASPVVLEPAVLVPFDFAESDGSWPDASCS
jgi:hypothetical protein